MNSQLRAGFSLIELLVVISIVAVLTTVGAVSYSNISKNNRDQRRIRDLQTIDQAIELYRHDTGNYPHPGVVNSTLAQPWFPAISNYLNPLPVDPINNATYRYRYDDNWLGDKNETCGDLLGWSFGKQPFYLVAQVENSSNSNWNTTTWTCGGPVGPTYPMDSISPNQDYVVTPQ